MAVIKLQTNASVPDDRMGMLARSLLQSLSRILGLPSSEMRVEAAGNQRMRMAESDEPIVHVEMKGVDFPKDRATHLTDAICPVIRDAIGVSENKIYIAVVSNRNSMWRVNGNTQGNL